ncbi:aldehyde dehydrogenase family protein [Paraburkholderia strydomiana]
MLRANGRRSCKQRNARHLRTDLRPVARLYRFESEEEVIRSINDTPLVLATHFYMRDLRRADRGSHQLEVGVIGLNEGAVASEAGIFWWRQGIWVRP